MIQAVFFAVLAAMLLSAGGCLRAYQGRIPDPVSSFVSGSALPEQPGLRLMRMVLDFNNDGLEDMAVSDSSRLNGSCVNWKLYLRTREQKYAYRGSLLLDMARVCIEPLNKGMTRISTCGRDADGGYRYYEYRLTERRLRRTRSEKVLPSDRRIRTFGSAFNIYKKQLDVCYLSDFLKTRNCLWKRERN
jgi:hypothetical protein